MKFFNKSIVKLSLILFFLIIFVALLLINYSDVRRKNATTKILEDAQNISNNTSFEINKIELYSSASATNVQVESSSWNLDLYQYTDIAVYVSNMSYNSISSIYIDNFLCTSLDQGSYGFCYKNLYDFGKFNLLDKTDRIDFELIEENEELDFSKPQLYSDLSNPITFEYVNLIEQGKNLSNSSKLSYDGSILKFAGIKLNQISPKISFKLHIVTDTGEEHTANVTFTVPLSDSNSSIYNGSFSQVINTSIKF